MPTAIITSKEYKSYASIFENALANETIKSEIAKYGYDEAEMNKGKDLYTKAGELINKQEILVSNEKLSYNTFLKKFKELKESYKVDKKKAQIAFKEERIQTILGINEAVSNKQNEFLDQFNTLYLQLQNRDDLHTAIKRYDISDDHVANQQKKLAEANKAYADYEHVKGQSQQATQDKNKALEELYKWVMDFYNSATLALKNNEQLLESLGKTVRTTKKVVKKKGDNQDKKNN